MQVGAGAGPGAAAGGDLLALHDLLPDLHLHAAQVAATFWKTLFAIVCAPLQIFVGKLPLAILPENQKLLMYILHN